MTLLLSNLTPEDNNEPTEQSTNVEEVKQEVENIVIILSENIVDSNMELCNLSRQCDIEMLSGLGIEKEC